MARKPIDAIVRMAGSFQTATQLLAADVEARGGNLAEALVLLARPTYARERGQIADILATIREQPEPREAEADAIAALAKRRAMLEPWVAFYERHFPKELAAAGGAKAFDNAVIPLQCPGLDQLEVVLKGLTMNAVYAEIAKQGYPCRRYADDLDGNIPKNDRVPTESYAFWHRGRDEADEELKNLSANDLASRQIKTMGVLEYEVFKLKHFEETKRHLDVVNITLLAGSRRADGRVPGAYWLDGEFRVDWAFPRSRDPVLRSREVVSG